MIADITDAFNFLMDIFKGKLPLHDLYLLGLIMIIMPIAEYLRETRHKDYTKLRTLFLKWVPISFLVISIYLTGFYCITNLITNIFASPDIFHDQQNVRSIAIMSLTMASISSLVVSLGKLDNFFITNKVMFTFMINSLLITIGMYLINLTWYKTITAPLWSYGLIGVINTAFMCFLLWEENKESIQERGRTMN